MFKNSMWKRVFFPIHIQCIVGQIKFTYLLLFFKYTSNETKITSLNSASFDSMIEFPVDARGKQNGCIRHFDYISINTKNNI